MASRRAEVRVEATAANWIDPPFNRVGFSRVEQLTLTASISRGSLDAVDLPTARHDTTGFAFPFDARTVTLPDLLGATHTDALVVLHNGTIAVEWYAPTMTASDTHLLMSVSKSVTSILCGVLVGQGRLETSDAVTDHIDELGGTSWEDCTVQHLLDMRTGTAWVYDRDEVDIMDVSAYRTHERTDLPHSTRSWIRSITNEQEHGGAFRYASLAVDVLGWVLERAGGAPLPDLLSRHVWSRLGTAHNASIIVDAEGFPVAEGGICTTPRDLARFGQMVLMGGSIDGRIVVPEGWLNRLRQTDAGLVEAFARSPSFDSVTPGAFYHDNWWIERAEAGVFAGLGIHGQILLIDHPSGCVVAKLSSQPTAEEHSVARLEAAGLRALCGFIAAT